MSGKRRAFYEGMDKMTDGYPSDLKPLVKKIGNLYEAHYRVPWGIRVVKDISGKPQRFDTVAQAFVAATGALLVEFRDRTTGWQRHGPTKARMEAEALFKGGNVETAE